MDSSTTQQCRQLEENMGGAQVVADKTGSRAYEVQTLLNTSLYGIQNFCEQAHWDVWFHNHYNCGGLLFSGIGQYRQGLIDH